MTSKFLHWHAKYSLTIEKLLWSIYLTPCTQYKKIACSMFKAIQKWHSIDMLNTLTTQIVSELYLCLPL